MYYNTNHINGESLKNAHKNNATQTDIVLKYFEEHASETLSPSEVWDRLKSSHSISFNTPLTSIRRSISDLTSDGKLTKSDMMKDGPYGSPEHQWFLNAPGQLELI